MSPMHAIEWPRRRISLKPVDLFKAIRPDPISKYVLEVTYSNLARDSFEARESESEVPGSGTPCFGACYSWVTFEAEAEVRGIQSQEAWRFLKRFSSQPTILIELLNLDCRNLRSLEF